MSAKPDDLAEELETHEGRTWRRACRVQDVLEDEGLRLGTLPPVAVFTSEGEYFCLDDSCTHASYPLTDGWAGDGVVECSLHLARFDLRTGAPSGPPATAPVAVHPATAIGDDVYVALPDTYLTKE
ncbi:non-heme iron oxygenase ferredoxin subunit [Amycolatopsis sp. VS8301801F10]|uniref:non-heme iron oxygenase ferredoxin subunit n=1 Tax=Amycolatopsis sp. VS8301801F10 TaxID=2652442 RepID=UPI0038FCF9AF